MRRLGPIALLALAACGGGGGAPAAPDTPPCTQAIDYRGSPALHAPVSADDWPRPDTRDWLVAALPAGLSDRLESRLDALQHTPGSAGITAAIGLPGMGLWTHTIGLARTTPPIAADGDSLFWWASVGKAYTAALVAQAARRGSLSQRDAIARWWPSFPEAKHITLDHLLTHTSGIRSFNSGEFEVALLPGRYHAPEVIIDAVSRSTNLFCPGGYWSYSNTGYVMLGRALERSEATSYAALAARDIFVPLGLTHSAVIGPGMLPSLVTAHPGGQPMDDAAQGVPFAAGNIAARAGEVLRFWRALLRDELLPAPTAHEAYSRLYPMFGDTGNFYGRGVMLTEWRDAQGRQRRWLAHAGGAPGANAIVAFDPLLQAYVAVAINSDVSAAATAVALLTEVGDWAAARGQAGAAP